MFYKIILKPMKSNKILLYLIIFVLIIASGCNVPGQAPKQVACSMEAKLCPDGSAVSRSGPNCEFAPCPFVNSGITEAEARAIAEKSCIKGGEALTVGTYNDITKTWWFDANLNATRPGCNPACVVNETTKTAEINWRCTGLIPPTSGNGTVSGQVLLGPTCPVEKNPPDPNCADKPYQTSIYVLSKNSPEAKAFKVVKTDAQGKYTVTLPANEYSLQPQGGSMLPRCETKDIVVAAGSNQIVNLACDSGIR